MCNLAWSSRIAMKNCYDLFKNFNVNFVDQYKQFLDENDVYHLQRSSSYVFKILEKINNFNILEKLSEDLNLKYIGKRKYLFLNLLPLIFLVIEMLIVFHDFCTSC